MSVVKLLSRIVAPRSSKDKKEKESLHDHTYGITSGTDNALMYFVGTHAGLILVGLNAY